MKRYTILSIIIAIIFPIFTFSQSALFEVKWASSNTNYTALIILDGVDNSYARVSYYFGGNTNVVSQNLEYNTQELITGETIVSLTGRNVKNIRGIGASTYNPDIFSFYQNIQGLVENFKVGDANNPLVQVASFKKIETVDRFYLKRFFNDLDPEFSKLLKFYAGNNTENKSNSNNNSGNLVEQIANAFAEASKSHIEFQNNTGKIIYVAICYYDQGNRSWTSEGWYKIEKYSKYVHELGKYFGDIYIHGQDNSLIPGTWGKGYSLCVDPNSSFKIMNANKVNCPRKKEFSKMQIKYGANKYTFNP